VKIWRGIVVVLPTLKNCLICIKLFVGETGMQLRDGLAGSAEQGNFRPSRQIASALSGFNKSPFSIAADAQERYAGVAPGANPQEVGRPGDTVNQWLLVKL
jgi:hypothetical protein